MGLWIAGVGGVGRETLDVAIALGVPVDGFLDDADLDGDVRGLPVRRPHDAPGDGDYVVGIASPEARQRLVMLLTRRGLRARTLVHPRAVVAPETTVAEGCVILANAHVSSSVSLASHCQVHYNATIGHDAELAEFVTIYPGANVSGSVLLGPGATVGSNAVILQGLRVGAGALVGAGAVVTRSVPDGAVVAGNPARAMKP